MAAACAVLCALAGPLVMAVPGAQAKPTPSASSTPRARPAAAASPESAGVPALGSSAARGVGGPLMASTGTVVNYPSPSAPKLPKIPASAWVIANASTGQVLAAKDPHGEFGPASTLKVLTGITLLPLLNPNSMVVASKFAADQQPNSAGLIPGRSYKVSSLFQALLLISANDAAVALTEATGSFAKGMALINAEARHLQAYDVVAKLPNGLPATGQVTSAYDEALIARQALQMPSFMIYDSTLSARFEVKPKKWETLVNQNNLLTQYPGALGGKIGWTISSEATYVGMARRNGVTLIATVLHCTALKEITSAEKLLNWGFAMNGKVKPVGDLVDPLQPARHTKPAKKRPDTLASSRPPGGPDAKKVAIASGGGVIVLAGLGVGGLATRRRIRRRRLRRLW
jgi:D-alanyl-D-alanine carboxypeptidase (penicillin-binding protein 5/6)